MLQVQWHTCGESGDAVGVHPLPLLSVCLFVCVHTWRCSVQRRLICHPVLFLCACDCWKYMFNQSWFYSLLIWLYIAFIEIICITFNLVHSFHSCHIKCMFFFIFADHLLDLLSYCSLGTLNLDLKLIFIFHYST